MVPLAELAFQPPGHLPALAADPHSLAVRSFGNQLNNAVACRSPGGYRGHHTGSLELSHTF